MSEESTPQNITLGNETLGYNPKSTHYILAYRSDGILNKGTIYDKSSPTPTLDLKKTGDFFVVIFFYYNKTKNSKLVFTNGFFKLFNNQNVTPFYGMDSYQSMLNEGLTVTANVDEANKKEIEVKTPEEVKIENEKFKTNILAILASEYNTIIKYVSEFNENYNNPEKPEKYAVDNIVEQCNTFIEIAKYIEEDIIASIDLNIRKPTENIQGKLHTELQQIISVKPRWNYSSLHDLKYVESSFTGNAINPDTKIHLIHSYIVPSEINSQIRTEIEDEIKLLTQNVTKLIGDLNKYNTTLRDFNKRTDQNQNKYLLEIAKLRRDYQQLYSKIASETEETEKTKWIEKIMDFANDKIEPLKLEIEEQLNTMGEIPNFLSEISKEMDDLIQYCNDMNKDLEKYISNEKDLKLMQNRQRMFLTKTKYDEKILNTNQIVELTNPHFMNYNSAFDIMDKIHYMHEFLNKSIAYNNSIEDIATVYEPKPLETKYPYVWNLIQKQKSNNTLKEEPLQNEVNSNENPDYMVDIGYENFMFIVNEFIPIFNRIRYHPLLFKLNGLSADKFNEVFKNTGEYKYISMITTDSNNGDLWPDKSNVLIDGNSASQIENEKYGNKYQDETTKLLLNARQSGGNKSKHSDEELEKIKELFLNYSCYDYTIIHPFIQQLKDLLKDDLLELQNKNQETSNTKSNPILGIHEDLQQSMMLKELINCLDEYKITTDNYKDRLPNNKSVGNKVNLYKLLNIIFTYRNIYFEKTSTGFYLKIRFFVRIMLEISYQFVIIKRTIHLFENQPPRFIKRIDRFIRDKNKDSIMTYIKFRNNEKNTYNSRFKVYLNNITKNISKHDAVGRNNYLIDPREDYFDTVLVKYNDDDYRYYDDSDGKNIKLLLNSGDGSAPQKESDGSVSLIDKIKFSISKSLGQFPQPLFTIDKNTENMVIDKYDRQYLLGKFTKIFHPYLSNAQIAEQMNDIIQQLLAHKPVFVLGYGASGAGKTSSLIYFNRAKENGILIELCKIMAEKGFVDIELSSQEFYDTEHYGNTNVINATQVLNENGQPYIIHNVPCGNTKILFKYDIDKKDFVLTEDYRHSNFHLYRSTEGDMQDSDITYEYESNNQNSSETNYSKTTTFKQNASMGKVMIHLVDTDRLVKATTNNPNSSRSHTLVYVKFIRKWENIRDYRNKNHVKYSADTSLVQQLHDEMNIALQTNEELNLIVGDFAGVENKFLCEEPVTISNFYKIKSDKNPDLYFYGEAAKEVDGAYDNGEGGNFCNKKQTGGNGFMLSTTEFEKKGMSREEIVEFMEAMKTSNIPEIESKDTLIEFVQNNYEKMYNMNTISTYLKKGDNFIFKDIYDIFYNEFINKEDIKKNYDNDIKNIDFSDFITKFITKKSTVGENAYYKFIYPGYTRSQYSINLKNIDRNTSHIDRNTSHIDLKEDKYSNIDNSEETTEENTGTDLIYNFRCKTRDIDPSKNNADVNHLSDIKKTLIDELTKYVNNKKKNNQDLSNNPDLNNLKDNVSKMENDYKNIEQKNNKAKEIHTKFQTTYNEFEKTLPIYVQSKKKTQENEKKLQELNIEKYKLNSEYNTNIEVLNNKYKDKYNTIYDQLTESLIAEKNAINIHLKKIGIKINSFKEQDILDALTKLIDSYKIIIKAPTDHNKATNILVIKKVSDKYNEKLDKLLQDISFINLDEKKNILNDIVCDTSINIRRQQNNMISFFKDKPTVNEFYDIFKGISFFTSYANIFQGIEYNINNTDITTNTDYNKIKPKRKLSVVFDTLIPIIQRIKEYNIKEQNIEQNNQVAFNCYNYFNSGIQDGSCSDPEYISESGKITEPYKENTKNIDSEIRNLSNNPSPQPENYLTLEKNFIDLYDNIIKELNANPDQNMNNLTTDVNNILTQDDTNTDAKIQTLLTNIKNQIQTYIDTPLSKLTTELEEKYKKLLESKNTLTEFQNIKTEIETIDTKLSNTIKYINELTYLCYEDIINFLKHINKYDDADIQKKPAFTFYKEVLFNKEHNTISSVDLKDTKDKTPKQIDLVEQTIVKLLKFNWFRHNYIKQVCNNRLKEGNFINASLQDLRSTLQDVISVKNSDAIDNVPNFVDICIADYCPKNNNCFKTTNTTGSFKEIKSVLIRAIFNKIYPNANKDPQYSIEDYIKLFYKELQICAFCVFNMSREKANNPPPVPYIDINAIKKYYYSHTDIIYDDLTTYKFEYPGIETNSYPIPYKPDPQYILNIRKSFYKECLNIVHIIDNKYNNDGRKTMIGTIQQDKIYQRFKDFVNGKLRKFIEDITSDEFKIKSRTNILEKKTEENTVVIKISKSEYTSIFQDFIEMIDNSNAISSIGTLEFMDQITKFNQTNVLCTLDNQDPTKYGMTEILDAIVLQ